MANLNGLGIQIHLLHKIVPRRGFQAALGAAELAQMAVGSVAVLRLFAASGTDREVVRQGAVVGVAAGGNAKGKPAVVLPQEAAQGIVAVEDHRGVGCPVNGSLKPLANKLRVAVAQHGVPEQIADDDVLWLQIRHIQGGDQLVHFDDGGVLYRPVSPGNRVQQTPGHTGVMICSPVVVGDGKPPGLENLSRHAGNGGLAVGSGDHNQQLGFCDIFQEVSAQTHGDHARTVISQSALTPIAGKEQLPTQKCAPKPDAIP